MGRWTALLERAAVEGSTLIERAVRTADAASNRWAVNYQGCEFGADWLLRAAVAHAAIYVNPVAEALYAVAELDSDGRPLTGRRRYESVFPAVRPAAGGILLVRDDVPRPGIPGRQPHRPLRDR